MAEVTGHIGNEEVVLNNAATEATLRLLLQSSLATTKEQKQAIASLAQKAGLDPAAVAAANSAIVRTTPAMTAVSKASYAIGAGFASAQNELNVLGTTLHTLTSGNASVSSVMAGMKGLPAPIQAVASGFTMLANFQQKILKHCNQWHRLAQILEAV